ncbi:MAG: metal-dependent transcriptional regulator [Clostridia bacterium]|nr:metal-dependent transcriptional regulator [Clostridia bacterium]
MKSNESAEMYLETILILKKSQAQVRAIDIVRSTGYTKPSVSRAVGLLKERGHIEVDESGHIELTEAGSLLATKILERHHVLVDFLKQLGVSDEIADDDACKMEHVISDETLEKMKAFLAKKEVRRNTEMQIHLL